MSVGSQIQKNVQNRGFPGKGLTLERFNKNIFQYFTKTFQSCDVRIEYKYYGFTGIVH